MQFFIENGPVFSILRVQMVAGEVIRAEAGAMVSMSPTIELKAKPSGKGVWGTLGAMLGGERMFIMEFTAHQAGELVLAPAAPGDIVHVPLQGGSILAQAGAYLAGSSNLQLSVQGSFKAWIGGEGLFLSKISGKGDLFLSSYGAIYQKVLASGETYRVDTGHIVAFDSTVRYDVRKASRGLFSTIASGEWMVCEYTGPGRIWIQTRNVKDLAHLLIPYIPRKSSS